MAVKIKHVLHWLATVEVFAYCINLAHASHPVLVLLYHCYISAGVGYNLVFLHADWVHFVMCISCWCEPMSQETSASLFSHADTAGLPLFKRKNESQHVRSAVICCLYPLIHWPASKWIIFISATWHESFIQDTGSSSLDSSSMHSTTVPIKP